ncbi:MAG: chemotaxis protein CheD [Thermoflexales bacterium]|nr:chemotaxis protein CheD [Thermoflexales bacterium]
MTENTHPVFIGEIVTSNAPDDVLVAYGLGSCVAVCLYDVQARVGGMLHALLPTANGNGRSGKPTKYVDQGVPLLVETLLSLGAKRHRLAATLCGGAWMLNGSGDSGQKHIGALNVQAAQAALHAERIRVKAHATGGSTGRTVRLILADGTVMVKMMGEGERPVT